MNEIINISDLTKDVPQTLSTQIKNSFAPYMEQIKPLVLEANSINVTSIDQTEDMKRARVARLSLVKIKSSIEADRKNIKAPYLRASEAIDAVGITLRDELSSVIKKLQSNEDFAKIQEENRRMELASKRRQELSDAEADNSIYELDLGSMSEQAFTALLNSAKQAKNQREEAIRKAELERVELEKKKDVFNKRQIEIAPYKFFAEMDKLTIETTESEYKLLLEKAIENEITQKSDQERIKKEQETARLEAEKKAKELERQRLEEQKKRESLEKQIKLQKEAEAKKRAAEEAALKADEEKKRQALLAPDKEKLLNLAAELDKYQLPAVSSNEAQGVIRATESMISKMSSYIREKAKAL